MRVLFAGTPAVAVPALTALHASAHDVVAVLTRPDARRGRRGRRQPSAVAVAAGDLGIPVLKPAGVRGTEFAEEFAALGVDAAVVVAFGALIPAALLAVPRHGWINLHFSLLPAWRGAAPVQAAIRAGDDVTGASTFLIEQGLDTGPVYGTVTEPIGPTDTAGALLGRLAVAGAQLLVATIDGIDQGGLRPVPQPSDGVSLAPKITAAQAEIDWTAPAFAVDRQIRALTPRPGASTSSRWGRLGIGPVTLVGDGTAAARLAPGEISAGRHRVLVGTGTEAVLLGTVQPPGRRPTPAADWARGSRPAPGDRVGGDPVGKDPVGKDPVGDAGSSGAADTATGMASDVRQVRS